MHEQIKIHNNIFDKDFREYWRNIWVNSKNWELHGSETVEEMQKGIWRRNFFNQQIDDEFLKDFICWKINKVTGFTFILKRMYVNCYNKNVGSEWHVDDGDHTILYYPQEWSQEFGGETVFRVEDKEYRLPYNTNSLVIFPAKTPHIALPHINPCGYRLTLALKTEAPK